jgi:23S rRNA maturation mini-RNase III
LAIKHSLKFKRPNKNTFSTSFNTTTQVWTNPIDGQAFDVSHLRAFFLDISYTKNEIEKTVRARVSFSAHCYTRSQQHLDDDELLVVTESIIKRRGRTKEIEEKKRVFDQERWNYSKSLPELMQKVQNMSCKRDEDNQVVIHLAPRNLNRPAEGWYTFVRVQVDPKYPDLLQLEVRTTHRRINHPASSKHPIRFSQHLAELLDE